MQPAIETQHLRKVYHGGKVAVADLTLRVERGEVFGFLGPNGAGKTTSVKMLLGLISPNAGRGELLGAPLGNVAVRAKVGFLPEHFCFHEWLTAKEFLTLHGRLYQMAPGRLKRRVPELLELVGLAAHAGKKLQAFSKGMLQRIGLAQALLNEPDLVILDEPTSGLDPAGRRLVRDIIRSLKTQGAAVFLNSHFLSEVEITCDRVAFIKDGMIVRTDALGTLLEGETHLRIRARGLTVDLAGQLARWGTKLRVDGEQVSLVLDGEKRLPEINRFLVEHGVEVFAFTPERVSLEDLFLQVMGDEPS